MKEMKDYSMRFLIAMIIGVCVMLLFLTGKPEQSFNQQQDIHSKQLEYISKIR